MVLVSPRRAYWLPLLLAGLGCESHSRPTPSASPAVEAPSPSIAAPQASSASRASRAFGAPISPGPEQALADVLAAPERFRDRAITVEGHVRSACTRRGCWMEVAQSGDPQLPGCRVTFKDYGFFVPTDSAGARAKVQGVLDVNTLPADRVAHLESEGGKFPNKNPDGSANELRLVATGVELWR